MIMNKDDIRKNISEMRTLFAFEYDGKDGNVDPYYTLQDKAEFLLYFDGAEQKVYSIDEVMNTPFINGKTLNELAGDIDVTEY